MGAAIQRECNRAGVEYGAEFDGPHVIHYVVESMNKSMQTTVNVQKTLGGNGRGARRARSPR